MSDTKTKPGRGPGPEEPHQPTEVVTRSLVRLVDAGLDRPLAMLSIDNGRDQHRPCTFGPQGLAALDAAVDEIAGRDVAALALTGKPFVFAAGADITMIPAIGDRAAAEQIGREGHRVFGRIRGLEMPTFAFLNGITLGGGLELALSCDYRTASTAAGMIAFPECFLGLVPGWGGCWLLPNLVGADAAVRVIIENPLANNRMLAPAQAEDAGIVDVVLDSADFLEQSIVWAARVVRGEVEVRRAEIDRGEPWDAAVARGRSAADAKVHGSAAAPYRALDLIGAAKSAAATEGFAAEDAALADLIMGDELRAGLYAFDLTQKRARRPAGAPDAELARPVTKVGIVGAGLMATQLAQLVVHRMQLPVVLTDIDADRLAGGVVAVREAIAGLAAKGRLGAGTAARLTAGVTGAAELAALADADLVIEAVFEDLDIKRRVFADLERVVSPDCVLATNTSSLSVAATAVGLEHPERVIGLHFFNPVAVLPLLEVVRADTTDDATTATALAVGKALKTSCVLVADAPAFVVNRVLTRLLGEMLAAVDEGTPPDVADRGLAPVGLPTPPLVLLQLVGPPIALHVSEALHAAFPDRFAVSPALRRIVEAKLPGIYSWRADGTPYVDDATRALLGVGDRASTGEQVRERALAAIADEIARMLDERVVAEAADVDLCMILGAGFPFHDGGITPYLDRTGVSEKVVGRRFLPRGVASVRS